MQRWQRMMRGDAADADRIRHGRFSLFAGHSSLTPYAQSYLGNFGVDLDDFKALAARGLTSPRAAQREQIARSRDSVGGSALDRDIYRSLREPPARAPARATHSSRSATPRAVPAIGDRRDE